VALAQLGDTTAGPELIEALRAEEANLRGSAAYALGCLAEPRALRPLRRLLKDTDVLLFTDPATGREEETTVAALSRTAWQEIDRARKNVPLYWSERAQSEPRPHVAARFWQLVLDRRPPRDLADRAARERAAALRRAAEEGWTVD
jgi:HEAT repeat protein